jgi:hypothetical protein
MEGREEDTGKFLLLTLIEVGFFERLISQRLKNAWREKFEKPVFLAKRLEMGTRLIIYPYTVILT